MLSGRSLYRSTTKPIYIKGSVALRAFCLNVVESLYRAIYLHHFRLHDFKLSFFVFVLDTSSILLGILEKCRRPMDKDSTVYTRSGVHGIN